MNKKKLNGPELAQNTQHEYNPKKGKKALLLTHFSN
jgi:hypothetical protein